MSDGFSVASGGRLSVGTDPALDSGGEPTDASQSYTFDRFGNLLTVTTEREGETPVTRTIGTSGSTNRLSVASYDLSGNVTAWAGREYRHDPFNMLWQTKPTGGNGHTFVYGPGDERLWTIDWTAGAAAPNWVSIWTLRDLNGTPLRQFRNVDENTTSANWFFHRDYVYRNGALLAAHTPEGLHHFHLDHLGSPRIITGGNGTTLARHLYFPFGEEATDPGQDAEALKFTGHERDDLDATGTTRDLDYMHARYFSTHLGRFLSIDTLPGRPGAPQSWNRYAYVEAGPLTYVDPTGLGRVKAFAKVVELTVGGGRKVVGKLYSREAARAAQEGGEDVILRTEKRAREFAREFSDGGTPIKEVGKGKGQYPHYHPSHRSGGHIFYSIAGGLTLSHYAQGRGSILETLAFLGDIVNPLSLGQDAIDLYEYFVEGLNTVFAGIEVTAPLSPYNPSAAAYVRGLAAQGHHTGNFTSTYDLFTSGSVCIDGVCYPPE